MDDNSKALGPPISFAEFNDLCDCKMVDGHQNKQCSEVVDKHLTLNFSDAQSIDTASML